MKKPSPGRLLLIVPCLIMVVSTFTWYTVASHAQSRAAPSVPSFDQSLIDQAVHQGLLSYPTPSSSDVRPGDFPTAVLASKAIYFLALVTWYSPNAKASNGTSVASRLVAQISNLVVGGHEPDANGSLEAWSHNDIAQAFLLAKNEPSVWSKLTADQRARVSLLMQALAIAGNWQFNDQNNFAADLDEVCHFHKDNNPNYREGPVGIVIAAAQFFGANQLNSTFTNFDYTSFTAQLKAAGFTNIIKTWANTGATLMMSGGKDKCGGSGVGARVPFVYQGATLNNLVGVFAGLALNTYGDKVTSTGANGAAYIIGHKTSPCQGMMGMEHEFNSTDSSGIRSDALYAFEGWMNSLSTRTTLTLLGNWGTGPTQQHIENLMQVGTADLLFKLLNGYEGRFLGQKRLVTETLPSSDGPSAKGFFFDQQVWDKVLASGTATTC